MNNEAVYRTAPATPGLLITSYLKALNVKKGKGQNGPKNY